MFFYHPCFCTALVGASLNQPDHLRFLYEQHEKFSVLPTFAVVPGLDAFGDSILTGDFCGYKVNMANVSAVLVLILSEHKTVFIFY